MHLTLGALSLMLGPMKKNGFIPTRHAVEQYQVRFAGNVTFEVAYRRLQALSRSVRRRRIAKGGAIAYRTNGIEMIVLKGKIVTVYRVDTRADGYALQS